MITPVEVPHDVKCFGFSFNQDDKKISIVTDLGHITDKIIDSISQSQIVYLEANYDRDMLYKGDKYPYLLKGALMDQMGICQTMSAQRRLKNLFQVEVVKSFFLTLAKKTILLTSHITLLATKSKKTALLKVWMCELMLQQLRLAHSLG